MPVTLQEAKAVAFNTSPQVDPLACRAAVVSMVFGILQSRIRPGGASDLKMTKKILDELVWKFSESSPARQHKRAGCPFWSTGALEVLRQDNGHIDATKTHHEHVFPRAELLNALLSMPATLSRNEVEQTLRRRGIGCVVLKTEHAQLGAIGGDEANPWQRYADADPPIRIGDNRMQDPGHSDLWTLHRDLIARAGLLDP